MFLKISIPETTCAPLEADPSIAAVFPIRTLEFDLSKSVPATGAPEFAPKPAKMALFYSGANNPKVMSLNPVGWLAC